MAQLIQIQQRIKAVEAIKKITHAMRLVAMSTHAHLKNIQEPLKHYTATLSMLFARTYKAYPAWSNPLIHPDIHQSTHHLFIIVGSHKGLCGLFNETVFDLFMQKIEGLPPENVKCIFVGKKCLDQTVTCFNSTVITTYPTLSTKTVPQIAQEISAHIINAPSSYRSVHIISTHFKTFFKQTPHEKVLIPLTPLEQKESDNTYYDYVWEQCPQKLLDELIEHYLYAQLYEALFASLLAEQAARFIAMDSATRNAQTVLDETQLAYNKLRQLKITKELAELMGSL